MFQRVLAPLIAAFLGHLSPGNPALAQGFSAATDDALDASFAAVVARADLSTCAGIERVLEGHALVPLGAE